MYLKKLLSDYLEKIHGHKTNCKINENIIVYLLNLKETYFSIIFLNNFFNLIKYEMVIITKASLC